MLAMEGIARLQAIAIPYIIVPGHDAYHPRFGFTRATLHGPGCQWEGIPDKAFMVMILDAALMKEARGVARYGEEFNDAI